MAKCRRDLVNMFSIASASTVHIDLKYKQLIIIIKTQCTQIRVPNFAFLDSYLNPWSLDFKRINISEVLVMLQQC